MAGNSNLTASARNKQDEFYTQLSMIESELKHYRQHFTNKVVLCNCDDPYESNFFKYFAMNFNSLGLKKLITTCYASSPVTGKEFEYYVNKGGQLSFIPNDTPVKAENEKRPYKVEITEVTDENGDGRIDLADVEFLMRNKKNTMTSNCQAKCNSLVEKVNRRNKVKTLPGAIVNQIKNSVNALS